MLENVNALAFVYLAVLRVRDSITVSNKVVPNLRGTISGANQEAHHEHVHSAVVQFRERF